MTDLQRAVDLYLARRDRRANPPGTFDRGGRFYVADEERLPCCWAVRSPSRAYPWSEMLHARTARHCANLCGVNESEVRREARRR